jgi:hypothetical protein
MVVQLKMRSADGKFVTKTLGELRTMGQCDILPP